MSRSNKARYSTRTKRRAQRTSPTVYKGGWKDSMGKSRSQVRSRAKWKKATKNSPKKTLHSRKPPKPADPLADLERLARAEGADVDGYLQKRGFSRDALRLPSLPGGIPRPDSATHACPCCGWYSEKRESCKHCNRTDGHLCMTEPLPPTSAKAVDGKWVTT